MSNSFDKLSVLDSFIEEVNSYLPDIKANLERLANSPGDMEALEESYRRTHTIGGSASMMSYEGLAHVANGMEDILGDAVEGISPLDPPTVALLQRSLDRLHRLLDGIRNDVDDKAIAAEDDADFSQYQAQMDAANQQSAPAAPTMPEVVPPSPMMPMAPAASFELDQFRHSSQGQNQSQNQNPSQNQNQNQSQSQNPSQNQNQILGNLLSPGSSMPSLDEVLASFRTAPPPASEGFSWPEESAGAGRFDMPAAAPQNSPPPFFEIPTSSPLAPQNLSQPFFELPSSPSSAPSDAGYTFDPNASLPSGAGDSWFTQDSSAGMNGGFGVSQAPGQSLPLPPASDPNLASALEMLAGGMVRNERKEPSLPPQMPQMPPVVVSEDRWSAESQTHLAALQSNQPSQPTYSNQPSQPTYSTQPSPPSQELVSGSQTLPQLYGELQNEAQALDVQASSFRNMLTELRGAASVVEAQRAEFKGFLDGSKDALDRMERWAGKAMGLNLRNSPEQVRRFLPLSVMWVSNNKLKKVLDVLNHITEGVQLTDEQLHATMQQLRESIENCNTVFQQVQADNAAPAFTQEPGWGSWEIRTSNNSEGVRERVTFERQGDLNSMRVEVEAQVRAEMQREIETERAHLEQQLRSELQTREQSPLSVAMRTELEQQIRAEVRQEYESNRQLHQRVAGTPVTFSDETLEELEARLRNEIEIQVRRDFLNQIGEASQALPAQQAPREKDSSWSFSGQADSAAAIEPSTAQQNAYAASHAPVQQPLPRPASTPAASTSSMGSDFAEEAAEIFRAEAEEHLQSISMSVASLEKNPNDRDVIQSIRRATHTLKGAAGMMGFQAIADLSHISEDLLDSIMEGTTPITSIALGLILDTAETLDVLINGKDTEYSEEALVQTLRIRYVQLLGDLSHANDTIDDDIDEPDEIDNASAMSSMVDDAQGHQTNAQRGARGDLSVRVPLLKLDELVNLFGEMLVNRSVLEERVVRLVRLVSDVGVSSARLRDVGQKLESRFEAATLPSGRSIQVMPGTGNSNPGLSLTGGGVSNRNGFNDKVEPSHFAEFDELELDRYTEFHQLSRGLSEGISDMATLSTEMEAVIRECEGIFGRENRLNTTFQDRLMKARLVPLSSMVPRIYRASRSVALKQHKEFELILEGEETEVDRTVFEEVAGPLLHLMRNAVNHAIEIPAERVRHGKSPAGQIKLSASYEGNQVVITVRDDGKGIDPEGVRATAIKRGLIRPNQTLNDHDVIDLIFRPGFSTAEVLSEESGRGVGLDVVRDSVSRLRGTLEVESMPGQGTAFTMKFPTSLAIQSAMTVMVADQQFAIPTAVVESIGRLDNFKRTTLGGRPAIVVQNDLYPLNSLAQYLSLPVSPIEDKAPLLLVNTGRHRVALIVDDIRGKLDVVMKNLGPHLRHVHGVAGGTVLGNGRVVLILELLELLSTHSPTIGSSLGMSNQNVVLPGNFAAGSTQGMARQAINAAPEMRRGNTTSMPPVAAAPAVPERGKHILVVDDSPSVRRVVSTMLKQHGWEVQMARDGVEALEMITHETPAAVLLDIEMPRMDGYELMATVRAQEQYRTLPLVVLTSRAATKHQQRAMQLGASAYVVKPYQDEELINTLNSLVYGASVR